MDNEIKFEGLLEKASGIFKNKSHVWVVLDTNDLSFYRQQKRSSCIGSIKIVDIQTVRVVDEKATQFEVRTDSKTFLFNASDAEQANTWVQVIKKAVKNNSPLRDTLQTQPTDRGQSAESDGKTQENNVDFSTPSAQSIFGVKLKPSRKSAPSPVSKDKQFSFPSNRHSNINACAKQDTGIEKDTISDCDTAIPTEKSETQVTSAQIGKICPSRISPSPPVFDKSVNDKPHTDSACRSHPDSKTSAKTVKTAEMKDNSSQSDTSINESTDVSESKEEVPCPTIVERRPISSNVHLNNGRNSPECIEQDKGSLENACNRTESFDDNADQPKLTDDISKTPDIDHKEKSVDRDVSEDIELRKKSDHSDVDISGVEMRRSRRSNRNSNRNNSTNKSWSRSVRSQGSLRNDQEAALPEIKIDTTDTGDVDDEVFNINEILGPLVKLGINGFDDKAREDVTWQSDACKKMREYLEENSEYPFKLSNHVQTSDDSVARLRNILCD